MCLEPAAISYQLRQMIRWESKLGFGTTFFTENSSTWRNIQFVKNATIFSSVKII